MSLKETSLSVIAAEIMCTRHRDNGFGVCVVLRGDYITQFTRCKDTMALI